MEDERSKFDGRCSLEPSNPEPRTSNLPQAERGVTLLELIVTIAIVMVLASVAMPLTKYSSKRSQELELRQKLREMRLAIDEFHKDWARDGDVLTGQLCVKNKSSCKEYTGKTGYPKELKSLLEVKLTGAEATVRESNAVRRYLRRISLDPMTGGTDWGLRCYQDPPDAQDWCKEDVFDVYTKSQDIAIDKSKYRDW
jgi:general secretion pathway protein G